MFLLLFAVIPPRETLVKLSNAAGFHNMQLAWPHDGYQGEFLASTGRTPLLSTIVTYSRYCDSAQYIE